MSAPDDAAAFVRALRPLVEHLGATVVSERAHRSGDFPVEWNGEVVAYVRGSELHGALDRVVRGVELDLGSRLSEMNRAEKQAAIRQLDEHGAFLLRGAVEDVATLMGVSRVTLYSYLNAAGHARDQST